MSNLNKGEKKIEEDSNKVPKKEEAEEELQQIKIYFFKYDSSDQLIRNAIREIALTSNLNVIGKVGVISATRNQGKQAYVLIKKNQLIQFQKKFHGRNFEGSILSVRVMMKQFIFYDDNNQNKELKPKPVFNPRVQPRSPDPTRRQNRYLSPPPSTSSNSRSITTSNQNDRQSYNNSSRSTRVESLSLCPLFLSNLPTDLSDIQLSKELNQILSPYTCQISPYTFKSKKINPIEFTRFGFVTTLLKNQFDKNEFILNHLAGSSIRIGAFLIGFVLQSRHPSMLGRDWEKDEEKMRDLEDRKEKELRNNNTRSSSSRSETNNKISRHSSSTTSTSAPRSSRKRKSSLEPSDSRNHRTRSRSRSPRPRSNSHSHSHSSSTPKKSNTKRNKSPSPDPFSIIEIIQSKSKSKKELSPDPFDLVFSNSSIGTGTGSNNERRKSIMSLVEACSSC